MRLALLVGAIAPVPGALAQALIADGSCRDGLPHGSYQVRSASGQVRVVGAFNKGKRTGSFLFWSGNGARLAQLPFEENTLSGTLALWYAPAGGKGEARPKVEAVFVDGRLSGPKRSWHPNGVLRAELRYEKGILVDARAFNEAGRPLPERDARALAGRDEVVHRNDFGSFDAIVRTNLPQCGAPAERLDKSAIRQEHAIAGAIIVGQTSVRLPVELSGSGSRAEARPTQAAKRQSG